MNDEKQPSGSAVLSSDGLGVVPITKEIPDFASINERGVPQCCLCYTPLKKARSSDFWKFSEAVQAYGWRGNSLFCSQRCAAEFAIVKASTMNDA